MSIANCAGFFPGPDSKILFLQKRENELCRRETHTRGLEFMYFCIYVFVRNTSGLVFALVLDALLLSLLVFSPALALEWDRCYKSKKRWFFLKDLHPRWSSYSSVLQSWWQEPSWSPSWSPCPRPSPCPLDHRWTRAPKRIICFR